MDVYQFAVRTFVDVALSAVGSSAVVLFFIQLSKDRWLAGVKHEYDARLEVIKDGLLLGQKELQVQIDRSVFVSKTQFDAEFKAMQDVFRFATDTWLPLQSIFPQLDTHPIGQTPQEREDVHWERWRRLVEPLHVFQTQIEVLSPFYPEDLYETLNKCRVAAQVAANIFQTTPPEMRDRDWMGLWREEVAAFTSAYKASAGIIRTRLDQLSVIVQR